MHWVLWSRPPIKGMRLPHGYARSMHSHKVLVNCRQHGPLGMKILLSAYACEPDKGSEPGVGWNWARTLVLQGHQVHLITRSNNREFVEAAVAAQNLPLQTSFYDLPATVRRWKRLPGGLQTYYLLWQAGAYRLARQLHLTQNFDCVHHCTFASFRQPSFMGRLRIPFLFGPVGGGETTPRSLRRGLPRKARRQERLRDFANSLVRHDPLMRLAYSQASVVACTTEETRNRLPASSAAKCLVQLAIGIDVPADSSAIDASDQFSETPTFLFVGRLIYWKGLHLALRALAEVGRQIPEARFRVVGHGEDAAWLKSVAEQAGVADRVEWTGWLPHAAIEQEYRNSTALVFPSFHDSGGMVVLESLAAGLPVVCLKLGGPGAIVNNTCGIAVEAAGADEQQVVHALVRAMLAIATDGALRESVRRGTRPRARQFTWDIAARNLYAALPNSQQSAPAACESSLQF